MIRIAAMSDIHGIPQMVKLEEPVDVLCITGDWSPLRLQYAVTHKDGRRGSMRYWIRHEFLPWLKQQPAEHIIIIPGNHDFVTEQGWFRGWFQDLLREEHLLDTIHYLCNESITLYGWRFWGCPYSDLPGWAWYSGGNVDAYTPKEETDILLVHAAPRWEYVGTTITRYGRQENFGSTYLTNALIGMKIKPKLVLFGHIHGGDHRPTLFGNEFEGESLLVNVSTKDEMYCECWDPTLINCEMVENATLSGMDTVITVGKHKLGLQEEAACHVIHTPLLKTQDE